MRRLAIALLVLFSTSALHAGEANPNAKTYKTPGQAQAAFQREVDDGRWGGPPSQFGDGGVIVRLKDIAAIQGVRENQLVGYGLVIGLNSTGDSLRNAPFTEQSMRAMLDNLGISPPAGASRSKNIAAVIVTANLPPFAGRGSRIDVTVSSLGDATSLAGGTLVMTPLTGADTQVYAVAQGNLVVSGYTASGQAATVTNGIPTSGRVPNGALVEREVAGSFGQDAELIVELRDPDFTTAVRITDTINAFAKRRYSEPVAKERDAKSIRLRKPKNITAARFLAEIEGLPVPTDEVARVVVDERTGTVVIGEKVRISRVAISHGTLSVRVTETPTVIQPEPFSDGVTAVEPNTNIQVQQTSKIGVLGGTDLESLVKGLNQIGVKPQGIIAILQGIKSAGALHAELVVQ
ncbi:flagellar basal body P-ring protein FlgI (plasmid) [Phyllobacterium sp. 628]|uniref:flagellar basal body P-ring protein FlgI n=1 Tax=Phyllobacterium sp. 628 TaxID=2718938 RepID=UPI0016622AF1|nr:flagellar basal body P-ring protein FlgI [Phyllobacterium sp. 628]QND50689.1 flagellar basal body P-ring protein FlgI [Phyllobacterium sp. 628]